jgi:gentisate 1,2-dioxygenase
MSPMFHFRGDDVRAALKRLSSEKGDPFEGIKFQFVNPVTGKPVYPTLDYSAQLLRPGEELQWKRETCSTYALILQGKGFSEIGGERYDWTENDVMAIPNFLWRQ